MNSLWDWMAEDMATSMPEKIELTLPFPPSANSYWRHAVSGGNAIIYVSQKGRDYQLEVQKAVADAGFPQVRAGRLRVDVMLCSPNKRKWDLDNRLKPLLDALEYANVFDDDELIDALAVFRGPIGDGGAAYVTIVPYGVMP